MTDMSASYGDVPMSVLKPREQMPLGRWATEDEVAAPICFLLSDDASMITGVFTPGGWRLHVSLTCAGLAAACAGSIRVA